MSIENAHQVQRSSTVTHKVVSQKNVSLKMQPLATTQRMMTWLSMCAANESTTLKQKRDYKAFSWAVFVSSIIGFTASLAYCLNFVFIDFNGAVFAFMAFIAEFGVIYFMIAAFIMRHKISDIFTNLSTIYKSSKFKHNVIKKP